ncbi:MAG: hypothetical protein WBN77_11605 [Desulfobacterales bacterium]
MADTRRVIRHLVFVITVLLYNTPLWAASSVPQVFLVQNSGWMLPFYDDPGSRLKDIVVELSDRVRKYGGEQQVVASFNQTWGENKSPHLYYNGNDRNKINDAIRSIEPAHKPGKTTYADTDFKEAIVGAINDFSPGKSCLLWIITNNKNSPDNSPETVKKNKEFYHFLQESGEIKRIVAFPYSLKVQSRSQPNFRANGLMIYALAYGDAADQLLQQMLSVNAPFGKQAARLKPLNAEALTFIPKGVRGSNSVKASVPDHKTLVLSFNAASKPEVAEISGQFRNDFYPYDIRSAIVCMTSGFRGGKEGITSQLSTDKISNIPAGSLSSDILVRISVPPIPSSWSPEVIFGAGYRANGVIRFELKDQRLEISRDFVKTMSDLFPNDPLPDLFVPGEIANNSVTMQPLLIQGIYPIWPTIVIGVLLLLIIGITITGIVVLRREKIYRVSVDGTQKPYGLRPFGKAVIKNSQGERVGMLKRGLGKPVATTDKGKNCNVRVM